MPAIKKRVRTAALCRRPTSIAGSIPATTIEGIYS